MNDIKTIAAELLPCPFCSKGPPVAFLGTENEIEGRAIPDGEDNFAVCCGTSAGGCGATSGYRTTRKAAITAWNHRTVADVIELSERVAKGGAS